MGVNFSMSAALSPGWTVVTSTVLAPEVRPEGSAVSWGWGGKTEGAEEDDFVVASHFSRLNFYRLGTDGGESLEGVADGLPGGVIGDRFGGLALEGEGVGAAGGVDDNPLALVDGGVGDVDRHRWIGRRRRRWGW